MTAFARGSPVRAPRVSSSAVGRRRPKPSRPRVRRRTNGSTFQMIACDTRPIARVAVIHANARYTTPRGFSGSTWRSPSIASDLLAAVAGVIVEPRDQRRVVGRLLALAEVAVDAHSPYTRGHVLRGQEVVDPDAQALVEVARPVVPPRVADLVGVERPVGVDELAVGDQPLEPLAFLGRDVRRADEVVRVVDVDVRAHHVHVAGDDERCAPQLGRALGHRLVEAQLVGVRVGPDRAAVGDVGGHDADPVDHRLDPAGLVDDGLAAQAGGRLLDRQVVAREDRDAGPGARGVVDGLVPVRAELQMRELLRRRLRLLEAEDLGPVLVDELDHPRQADVQRVDVPGDDLHATRATSRRRLMATSVPKHSAAMMPYTTPSLVAWASEAPPADPAICAPAHAMLKIANAKPWSRPTASAPSEISAIPGTQSVS